jgi:predicted phosphodiesterase
VKWLAVVGVVACGPGNGPLDYPPPALGSLGLHDSLTYVARNLTLPNGVLLAHPKLGQPAVHVAGDTIDVAWIAPELGSAATLTIDGVAAVEVAGACDADGVCHATLGGEVSAALATGLHALCVGVGAAQDCSSSAIAIVDAFHDPVTLVHVSDAHVGDGDSLALFDDVVASINSIEPQPDAIVFTGDGADVGTSQQHADFIAELAKLRAPVFAVTGNHDYDAVGIDSWLLDVAPELDYAASLGAVRLIGVSSGQDLDDGNHDTTISESSGPDASQLAWLGTQLPDGAGSPPTVVFFHHPIYNGLFATIGPDSRDALKALVTEPYVRAVLSGHTHISAVFDADGDSRGLSLDADVVDPARWPLHYIASRATRAPGGYAVLHVGTSRVDYRWVELP